MMLLLQAIAVLILLAILLPLAPPMVEYYGAYCEWLWRKLGIR